MAKNVRVMITLSAWEWRHLKIWAAIHGRPASTYAGQIVAARVEANFELIEKMLGEEARFQGKTPDELEAEILNLPEEE